jgi:hypothetical protein
MVVLEAGSELLLSDSIRGGMSSNVGIHQADAVPRSWPEAYKTFSVLVHCEMMSIFSTVFSQSFTSKESAT